MSKSSFKWPSIQKKFPNMWVAVKSTSVDHPFDGEVMYSHPDRKIFHAELKPILKKEKHLAISFTGNPIRTPKGDHVLLSVWQ